MRPPLLRDPTGVPTPALLIDLDRVDANIRAVLAACGGDPARWRPHVKTAKAAAVMQRFLVHGITQFKCATTKEWRVLAALGAPDVLLAFPLAGVNAERARALFGAYPGTRASIVIEDAAQLMEWQDSGVGVFVDLNPGMDRTGQDPAATAQVVALAQAVAAAGCTLRGLHWYDGHAAATPADQRVAVAHAGYQRLLALVAAVRAAGVAVPEIIVAGTPAAPAALAFTHWAASGAAVQISPGTVVFNDRTSLAQLPDWGLQPAAVVLSRVVSHPRPGRVTLDAGHKTVSADAGLPTCAVLGHPDWTPGKPSEEHLPVDLPPGEGSPGELPPLGQTVELLPTHICPTVNNFDEALLVQDGQLVGPTPIDARGRDGFAPNGPKKGYLSGL